jgi:hypothetical protein
MHFSHRAFASVDEMSMFRKPKRKGWKNPSVPPRQKRIARSGIARTTYEERELMKELAPPLVTRGDYLYANCVVLAAAIFAEPWAKQWAEDLLPQARLLDWRRTQ